MNVYKIRTCKEEGASFCASNLEPISIDRLVILSSIDGSEQLESLFRKQNNNSYDSSYPHGILGSPKESGLSLLLGLFSLDAFLCISPRIYLLAVASSCSGVRNLIKP